jgi:lipopolysaccharide transport system permease protein
MSVTISNKQNVTEYIKETFRRKNLIFLMAKRDLRVKYAQSVLGIAWIVVQPLTGMAIFTLFFTQVFLIDVSKMDIPYHLHCFSGFMCWLLFSNIIGGAGVSLMQEEHLIKKVYFPRIIIPSAKTLNYLMDFLFSFLVLLLISLFYDCQVLWRCILTFPAIVLILINGFTLALWLSALTMRFRDFNHFIPYVINFGIWLTPVFFPMQLLPEKLRFIVEINPMTYAIELFRSLLYGLQLPHLSLTFIIVQTIMLVLLFWGLKYFIKIDKLLSDYL